MTLLIKSEKIEPQNLTHQEMMITGGNPIAIAFGFYCGALTVAYYLGYGAHAVYDSLNK